MTRIISGALVVSSFDSTGSLGEYSITGAIYNSANDDLGNGARDLHVGMVLYVPASDPNTFFPIAGKVHRYKLTSITVVDQQTINTTIKWDEQGSESDAPTNNCTCVITEVSEHKKLGFTLPAEFYPTLSPGINAGIANSDLANIIDLEPVGNGNSQTIVYTQNMESDQWVILHDKNSTNFVYSIFDDTQSPVWPDRVEIIDANSVRIYFLVSMAGKVVFNFV